MMSTTEIISSVFDEFTPELLEVSNSKERMTQCLQRMRTNLIDRMYTQYYNTTSRFMKTVDMDDVLCSSPKGQGIRPFIPNTPIK